MKHAITLEGFAYRLRPVVIEDAAFIVDVRTRSAERSKFMHAVSKDIDLQRSWIEEYFAREGDYYFIIENRLTGKPEGLIGIYDLNTKDNIAEWGRWIIESGSLAATESVLLMYKIAFEFLKLDCVFSRTVAANTAVVSFHDSAGARNDGVLTGEFEIRGKKYDAVKHTTTRSIWQEKIVQKLTTLSEAVYRKHIQGFSINMQFHHIGIATRDIEQERFLWEVLGYFIEQKPFVDEQQGIRGVFLISETQPRIELLENLPGSRVLTPFLEKGIKVYHFGYKVTDLEPSITLFTQKWRGKLISPPKPSVAFGGRRICFIMLPNSFIIEFIEEAI